MRSPLYNFINKETKERLEALAEEFAKMRWGYTFLIGESRLNEKQRLYLVAQTTVAYLCEREKADFASEELELDGKIALTKRNAMLGTFFGPQYDTALATNFGRTNVRFIVSEQTLARLRNN